MTDPVKHYPLGGASRETHPGDQLDCEPCRAALLAAFREPADSDYPPMNAPVPPYKDGGLPHLFPGPEHTRTVDLSAHQVESFVEPYPDRPGGLWSAVCSCGWSKAGPYARDGAGEIVADRLAGAWADRHRKNPLEGDEDE